MKAFILCLLLVSLALCAEEFPKKELCLLACKQLKKDWQRQLCEIGCEQIKADSEFNLRSIKNFIPSLRRRSVEILSKFGIQLSDSEADLKLKKIFKKVLPIAKEIGKEYLKKKYGIPLSDINDEKEAKKEPKIVIPTCQECQEACTKGKKLNCAKICRRICSPKNVDAPKKTEKKPKKQSKKIGKKPLIGFNRCTICKKACPLVKDEKKKKVCEAICEKLCQKKAEKPRKFRIGTKKMMFPKFDKCSVCQKVCPLIKDEKKKEMCEKVCKMICEKKTSKKPMKKFFKKLMKSKKFPKLDKKQKKSIKKPLKKLFEKILKNKKLRELNEPKAEKIQIPKKELCLKACDILKTAWKQKVCKFACDHISADSDLSMKKMFKKVLPIVKKLGKEYIKSQGIPLSDSEADESMKKMLKEKLIPLMKKLVKKYVKVKATSDRCFYYGRYLMCL